MAQILKNTKMVDKQVAHEMCKLVSAEYDVKKTDVTPFIAVFNIIHQEYSEKYPEVYKTLIALLHDYNPFFGKEYRQRYTKYVQILLEKQPELADYIISVLPDGNPPFTNTNILQSLPVKMPSLQATFMNGHVLAHRPHQRSAGNDSVLTTKSETHCYPYPAPFYPPQRLYPQNPSGVLPSLSAPSPYYCPAPWLSNPPVMNSKNDATNSQGSLLMPDARIHKPGYGMVSVQRGNNLTSLHNQKEQIPTKLVRQLFHDCDKVQAVRKVHEVNKTNPSEEAKLQEGPNMGVSRNLNCFPYTQQVTLPDGKTQNIIIGQGLTLTKVDPKGKGGLSSINKKEILKTPYYTTTVSQKEAVSSREKAIDMRTTSKEAPSVGDIQKEHLDDDKEKEGALDQEASQAVYDPSFEQKMFLKRLITTPSPPNYSDPWGFGKDKRAKRKRKRNQ